MGVFWIDNPSSARLSGGAQDVFVTRLHIRYDAENFPTDIAFKETNNRENYQGRYILRHPWDGKPVCEAARAYLGGLPKLTRTTSVLGSLGLEWSRSSS